jgi:hypothetical protein
MVHADHIEAAVFPPYMDLKSKDARKDGPSDDPVRENTTRNE